MPDVELPDILWDLVDDDARLPFSPDGVDLSVRVGKDWGLCDAAGVLTLEGIAVLACNPPGRLPEALYFEWERNRLPLGEPPPYAAEPPAPFVSGPPLTLAIPTLSEELVGVFGGRNPPLEALLRELLTNAAMHRRYDQRFRERSTRVVMYTDAIEVRSPGLPVGAIARGGAWFSKGHLRNRTLAAALKRVGLARLQRHSTRGIRGLARTAGMTLAIELDGDETVVRLQPTDAFGADQINARGAGASQRRGLVLTALGGRSWCSRAQVCEWTRLPDSSARSTLRQLFEQGLVERERAGATAPNQRYRLVRHHS